MSSYSETVNRLYIAAFRVSVTGLLERCGLRWVAAVAALCLYIAQAGCVACHEQKQGGIVLPTCLEPAVSVFVTDVDRWPDQVRLIPSLRPGQIIPVSSPVSTNGSVSYGLETPWTTDQWVFGWRSGAPVMIDMSAEGTLKEWGVQYAGERKWQWLQAGTLRAYPDSRFDAGGDVLVSPPVEGRFPNGRIITSLQIQEPVKAFFRGQHVQTDEAGRLIEVDTGWLKVGHVDELVSFLPVVSEAGRTGRTFRLVLPDYPAGRKLLESVSADAVLFAAQSGKQLTGTVRASGARFIEVGEQGAGGGKWKFIRITSGKQAGLVAQVHHADRSSLVIEKCWDLRSESAVLALESSREGRCDSMPIWFEPPEAGSRFVAVEDSLMWLDGTGEEVPAVITAGELLKDEILKALASGCGGRIDGPGGIRETVVAALGIRPEEIVRLPVLVRGNAEGRNVTALVPNPVNLVPFGREVVLLKPFGPRLTQAEESTDVFLREWSEILRKLGLTPVFLDGWNVLHRLEGGARCGMNVQRRAP